MPTSHARIAYPHHLPASPMPASQVAAALRQPPMHCHEPSRPDHPPVPWGGTTGGDARLAAIVPLLQRCACPCTSCTTPPPTPLIPNSPLASAGPKLRPSPHLVPNSPRPGLGYRIPSYPFLSLLIPRNVCLIGTLPCWISMRTHLCTACVCRARIGTCGRMVHPLITTGCRVRRSCRYARGYCVWAMASTHLPGRTGRECQ